MTDLTTTKKEIDECIELLDQLSKGTSLHIVSFVQYRSCELWYESVFIDIVDNQCVKTLLDNEFIFNSETKEETPRIEIYTISKKGLDFIKEVS